jgi:hypothetical protein
MIEIRDGRLGKAIHATQAIEAGRCVLKGWGGRIAHRSRHSIQVDHDRHVVIPGPIELINHSCEPNCGVLIRPEAESLEIYSLRPIAEGEELSTDYASFEYEILFMPGRCLCGSPICRGKITGYKDLPAKRKAALGRYIARYLREMDVRVEQTA